MTTTEAAEQSLSIGEVADRTGLSVHAQPGARRARHRGWRVDAAAAAADRVDGGRAVTAARPGQHG
jgi:hypothetical protein